MKPVKRVYEAEVEPVINRPSDDPDWPAYTDVPRHYWRWWIWETITYDNGHEGVRHLVDTGRATSAADARREADEALEEAVDDGDWLAQQRHTRRAEVNR